MSSTKGSFTSRYSHKLPQLNRSFSGSTAKSTTLKLSIMDDNVQKLLKQTTDLKLQTRVWFLLFQESRRFTNFLREDLGDRLAMESKNNLMAKINALDKYSKMSRLANEQRTQQLKDDCQALHDSSINLKNFMYSLSQRVD